MDTQRGPDVDGANREIIVFHLVPLAAEASNVSDPLDEVVSSRRTTSTSFDASNTNALPRKQVVQNAYFRSHVVKRYVLTRANGKCESCGQQAPFNRKDGTPYLEPHHTREFPMMAPIILDGSARSARTAIDGSTRASTATIRIQRLIEYPCVDRIRDVAMMKPDGRITDGESNPVVSHLRSMCLVREEDCLHHMYCHENLDKHAQVFTFFGFLGASAVGSASVEINEWSVSPPERRDSSCILGASDRDNSKITPSLCGSDNHRRLVISPLFKSFVIIQFAHLNGLVFGALIRGRHRRICPYTFDDCIASNSQRQKIDAKCGWFGAAAVALSSHCQLFDSVFKP